MTERTDQEPGQDETASVHDPVICVLVAVTRYSNPFRSRILGYDATTGEELFAVRDARLPLLAANGRGLVLQPDNAGTLGEQERDAYVQSVTAVADECASDVGDAESDYEA